MPSKLPIIKANTTQENIDKMKVIAVVNKRSVAKELEWLIEKHIAEYEAENGEIVINESKKTNGLKELTKLANDPKIPFTEKARKSFKLGFDAGAGKELKKDE